MKAILICASALAAVFAATGASAATGGVYGAVDVGYYWPAVQAGTIPVENEAGNPSTQWHMQSGPNPTIDGRLGFQFNPHWRVEGEVGYRSSPITAIPLDQSNVVDFANTTGSVTSLTAMANVIYDFGAEGGVDPFIGVGGGINEVAVKGTFTSVVGTPLLTAVTNGATHSVGAWQVLAGVAFTMSPQSSIDVTYRYLDGAKYSYSATLNGSTFQTGAISNQVATFSGVNGYHGSSLTVGWRYWFTPPGV